MSYAPLDPDDAVVLFADLQEGIIEHTATVDLARLRRAVAAVAKLAALFEIPARDEQNHVPWVCKSPPGRRCRRPSAVSSLVQHDRQVDPRRLARRWRRGWGERRRRGASGSHGCRGQ